MRQWNVDPRLLCDRHLLGEHVEHHMFVGTIRKGRSLSGFLSGGLLDTRLLRSRHAALAEEMKARGMLHASPLGRFRVAAAGAVDSASNLKELARRCAACRKRIKTT